MTLKLCFELPQKFIAHKLLILLAVEINVKLDQTFRNSANLKILLAKKRESFLLNLFPEITFLDKDIADLSIMDDWLC